MIENQQVLEFIGKTKTQKLIDEITAIYKENFLKQFPKYQEFAKCISIVSVTEKDEIKSIGMSCINDLISDNFGEMFRRLWTSGGTASLIDFNNNLFSYTTVGTQETYVDTAGVTTLGSAVQIGSGVTPATRQDFSIESAFASSPENVKTFTGDGGWNSGLGKITISTLISPTTGSGAISETVLFGVWRSTLNTFRFNLLSRDNISPVVNFISAQTINIDYEVLLS